MDGRLRAVACVAAVAIAALASPAWAAHAQEDEGGPIPEWVRTVFGYYADGVISDAELLAALQYLADQGVIRIWPVPSGEAPAMSDEAAWAADEAEYVGALATRLRDDMRAFRVQLHAGTFIPGEPADYEGAIEASRAEVAAVEAYADALHSAAADGRITSVEQAAIDKARRAAEDAEEATYKAILATPMASELELYMAMDMMVGGGMVGPPEPVREPAPSGAQPAGEPKPQRRVATAAEAADESSYLASLAGDQRRHLRSFQLGMAGSDYRTTGVFGSAGSNAAYAAAMRWRYGRR